MPAFVPKCVVRRDTTIYSSADRCGPCVECACARVCVPPAPTPTPAVPTTEDTRQELHAALAVGLCIDRCMVKRNSTTSLSDGEEDQEECVAVDLWESDLLPIRVRSNVRVRVCFSARVAIVSGLICVFRIDCEE